MTGPAWETHQLLFVYGSLLLPTGDAGVDAAVASGVPLGEAWMPGTLHDLGEYPGAKLRPDVHPNPEAGAAVAGAAGAAVARAAGEATAGMVAAGEATAGTMAASLGADDRRPRIRGRLMGFPAPEPAFAVLDRYEGFDPASPESGEFARVLADVVLAESGRTVTAQVYLYMHPVAGKAPIPDGDYLAYRRMRKEAGV